eukprot:CAMPEP_0181243836 /NCGR_PEP_ID=MMETSP1096-20121128/42504_1 /TAXON_ID=156174 ORGANISM="Chrysochromulina ericina, Strain CCMP281" /NCGR_SAMPLE_ID=MMETSP1096 /ASSEMBLY_ACC=CAM_ASM_000453 /LENGTH=42 /DNA_ID= /DNA_START= /DNA_END= /DNA_ORIENTATION=
MTKHGDAPHQARFALNVEVARSMQRVAIVPNDQIAAAPLVRV